MSSECEMGRWMKTSVLLSCHLLSFASVKKLAAKTGHVFLHPPKWWRIDFVGNKFQEIQQKVNKSRPETVSHAQLWNSTPYVMSQMAPILSRSGVGFGFCPHQSPTKARFFLFLFFREQNLVAGEYRQFFFLNIYKAHRTRGWCMCVAASTLIHFHRKKKKKKYRTTTAHTQNKTAMSSCLRPASSRHASDSLSRYLFLLEQRRR